jgi:hypothetical protein
MRRICCALVAVFIVVNVTAQELYVFSEPASNMPAKAMGLKYAGKFLEEKAISEIQQRHMLELQLGHNKKWMTHIGTTFSDMYGSAFRWESVKLYSKYRFLSIDDVHKHFRAAAFGEIAYSVNDPMYDELSLDGDQSGVRGGLIVTQLLHKLALSSTISYIVSVQDRAKHAGIHDYNYNSLNYSLSAGYLLFPRKYNSYDQTNINLYVELLGSQALDTKSSYHDIAPAIQFIFSSNTKLNLGGRFQIAGNMNRMAENSFLISIERTFLNALKKRS